MKQKYAVVVLFALVFASGFVSLTSYKFTEREVTGDMNRALALTMAEQRSDVLSADTVQVFNRHLRMEALRGRVMLAVDTRHRFSPRPQCSVATIFSLSDQRPAWALCALTLLWAALCLRLRGRSTTLAAGYGGLLYVEGEGRFYDARGEQVRLTPMQHQLLEMFFRSPSHLLTKAEICAALWPKKADASETLYTLMRRLKPVVEQHTDLKIESVRGRAYELKRK